MSYTRFVNNNPWIEYVHLMLNISIVRLSIANVQLLCVIFLCVFVWPSICMWVTSSISIENMDIQYIFVNQCILLRILHFHLQSSSSWMEKHTTYTQCLCIQCTHARLLLFEILPFQIHMCVTIALTITITIINNPHLTVSKRTTHSFNNKIRSNKLIT